METLSTVWSWLVGLLTAPDAKAAIWGFIGTLVGALASIATTIYTGRNAAALQSEATRAIRQDKHRAVQEETLKETQDELDKCLQYVYATAPLTNGLAETTARLVQFRDLSRRTTTLVERVADDALRESLRGLMGQARLVVFEANPEGAMTGKATLAAQDDLIRARIGEALRAQY